MREDEARTKWCPMARCADSSENIPLVVNRMEAGDNQCIASDCMMWVSEGRTETFAREKLGHCGLTK